MGSESIPLILSGLRYYNYTIVDKLVRGVLRIAAVCRQRRKGVSYLF